MDQPAKGAPAAKKRGKKAAAKPVETESSKAKSRSQSMVLPVIPLKDMVVFPRMILPLFIARPNSLKALDEAQANNGQLALLAQVDPTHAYPEQAHLPKIGVHAQILQALRMPDGSTRIMVECRQRIRRTRWLNDEPFLQGRFVPIEEPEQSLSPEQEVLVQLMTRQFEIFIQQASQGLSEMVDHVPNLEEPGALADMIAAFLSVPVEDKQRILETLKPLQRLEAVGRLLNKSLELQAIENQINSKLKETIDQHQKEYFLREKIRAIREELGEESGAEADTYREKIAALTQPEVQKQARKELARLEKMPQMSAESGVIRTYLDTLLELPWHEEEPEAVNLKKASERLDQEHFGLDKVKDRILEYLAVQNLTQAPPKAVLCLSGPPGVGKTSLARAVAEATGRKFERIALGGVGDDAEIRGHRRTYIGALPGRLIQALQRAGTTHTVILLDELDKLTRRFSGDPASALLEVLDPEQNNAFRDHYLEVPFDLSKVFFICAANVTHTIPGPLLDRMQVLRLSGYTEAEKLQIARRHLIPRQAEQNGLKDEGLSLTQPALMHLLRRYTREAGVRELDRLIGQCFRWYARKKVEGEKVKKQISSLKQLSAILGPPRYKNGEVHSKDTVGLVNGLAWTSTGGSVLPVEVALSPGKGKLRTTGSLGEVMKESMQLALSCIQQRAKALKIAPERFQEVDIHIHVPEGAIPKDGPSAGIAISSALASVLTDRPARADVAMTGEVTLLGKVLPIGGLKEKALAAYNEGIRTVLVPQDNVADLEEIPADIRSEIKFVPVQSLEQVLKQVLR
ncbi:MAG: endopeptidase La [Candidatus Sericytochromatia bacterium]|nr:endopeptidase La [Candidatus Sericytochromatia bacterium]